MTEKKRNFTPFDPEKMKPIPSRSGEVSAYGSEPGKIIRQEWHDWRNKEDMIEAIKEQKDFLRELQDDYGFNIPPTEFVAGEKEKGYTKIYQVTDRVDGVTLDKYRYSEKDSGFVAAEGERIILSSIKYLRDKITKEEDFMQDIFRPDNYMYGQTPSDRAPKIYFTDLAKVVAEKRKSSGKELRYAANLYVCAREIAEFIVFMEKAAKTALTEPREKIKELCEYLNQFEIDDLYDNKAKTEELLRSR